MAVGLSLDAGANPGIKYRGAEVFYNRNHRTMYQCIGLKIQAFFIET